MTNEENEQKCDHGNVKSECRYCIPFSEYTAPPQEGEAKGWTYVPVRNEFGITDNEGDPYCCVQLESVAKEICDRFNELDRLRSSMQGKVPEITQDIAKEKVSYSRQVAVFGEREANAHWQLWMMGAQWMHSEVAPIIAGLESRNLLMLEAEKGAVNKINSLQSDLKQAKEALSEADNELNAILGKPHSMTGKIAALLTPKKEEK